MIVGNIEHLQDEQAGLSPVLQRALRYLAETDFSQLADGKHPIQGDAMFALVQSMATKAANEVQAEAHYEKLDIHYTLSGVEWIGVAPTFAAQQVTEDRPQQDVRLYDRLSDEAFLAMKPGRYAIFFPTDIHRPGCMQDESQPVRKVVVKIDKGIL